VDRGNPESESPRLPGAHPHGVATLEAQLLGAAAAAEEGIFQLRISPLNLFQTVGIWRSLKPRSAQTLVLAASLDGRMRTLRGDEALGWLRRSASARFGREIEAIPADPAVAGGEAWSLPSMLLLDDHEFEWFADTLPWLSLSAVRLEGEVEAADALAFARYAAAGEATLAADVRSLASLELSAGGVARFAARSMRPIAAVVAEDLAFYVAAVLRCQPELVSRPNLGEIGRLLAETGRILVRPEETDVFGSSIDIGVSTAGPEQAAGHSIIYDLPSDSWHHE
jgi:hypothetical protein